MGCNDRFCRWDTTDAEMLALYSNADLETVYEVHERLVSNCTPARTTLAVRIADFGPPAKAHALAELEPESIRSFMAAVSVVGMVNTRYDEQCTPAERHRLTVAVEAAASSNTEAIYRGMVEDACASDTAPTIRPATG
jgi:hypothetical protein